jgi:3-polyprenyl-4-hydroxybenzoate decarboxylase
MADARSVQVKAIVPAQRRLIIGISRASGVIYGLRVLQLLRTSGVETHLAMSKIAERIFAVMVDHTVGRMLDLFEIDVGTVRRWGEDPDLRGRPVKS